MSADVREVTADYEAWLAGVLDLVPAGLAEKHRALAADDLRFLRGTYYLWLVRVAERLPDVLTRPAVPLVGDLHVENFGTWRDRDQVRRWGVNDLDELADGSWLLDLLRLATSASLTPHVRLDDAAVCAELLQSYADAQPAAAIDLADHAAEHLRALVPPFADPAAFYARLADGRPVGVPPAVAAAAATVAEPGWRPTWHEHEAGTGSLGHVRAAGVGPAADRTTHAREVKQLGPGTAVWAAGRIESGPRPTDRYADVEAALRGPAGATRVDDWQVRDLAPDVVRIRLSGLHHHDARRLLRSMARAAADVHAASGQPAAATARADASRLDPGDLAAMVETMVAVTRADRRAWRR